MREEVPPPLIDAHLKAVQTALKEGKKVDTTFALDKTDIAGTKPEKDSAEAEKEEEKKDGEGEGKKEEKTEKKEV
jgi:hypothetical protein